MPLPKEGPFFLVAHIGVPHTPIRYDEHCSFFPEGSDYFTNFTDSYINSDTAEDKFNALLPQIKCSHKIIIKYVES